MAPNYNAQHHKQVMLRVHLYHVVFLRSLHKICCRMPWNVWNICPQILCHTAKARCECYTVMASACHCHSLWEQKPVTRQCDNRSLPHHKGPAGPSGDMSHAICWGRKLVFEYCTIWWIVALWSVSWLPWPHFRKGRHNVLIKLTLRTCCFCCTCKVPNKNKEQHKVI